MNGSNNNFAGICLGASTLSLVEMRVNGARRSIVDTLAMPHFGNIQQCLKDILDRRPHLLKAACCITGRKLRHTLRLSSISEPEAVELAVRHVLPPDHPYRAVMSAGGETFILYLLDDLGHIRHIQTGNKCASGTGEFFLQQLHRMNLSLDDVAALDVTQAPYKVSGRCSVFCKSDCTHALNKGVPRNQVIGGLTAMMADKLEELLGQAPRENVLLIGGCASNIGMVHHLRQKIHNLRIPDAASCFEALGAACWAIENRTMPMPAFHDLFKEEAQPFTAHPPLGGFKGKVRERANERARAENGDSIILGLDVGSTSTKGVLMRRRDKAIVAACYLRTNGDPIRAARNVYLSLSEQVSQVDLAIDALGVTGSGRQIAGLHAQATGIINEIIAHATAAAYFDPEVDTIFEIGGQDAKYTFLTNGVPNDYAMNEACSAGTGSFLEESAKESLGLAVEAIGEIAYQANTPPNFSDQCAAFISSDIKGAVQQNISTEDIVAGLVYSICQNYIRRVVGNRPVGRRIFVQGGVCYNPAVPAAMAALTGKEVVVPPDPGLMGAFGVALEVERRMERGQLECGRFDLNLLAGREIGPAETFSCRGGKEKCDNKCLISLVEIEGRKYPFGGICNRYDNLARNKSACSGENLVAARQQLVFSDNGQLMDCSPKVRMNRSFLINSYYPFFSVYLRELGYRLVLPTVIDPQGVARKGSSFCYPAEIAHGYGADLHNHEADFTLLPQVKGLPSEGQETSCTCVFVQGEPYYLRSTFPGLDQASTLSPVIDFSKDESETRKIFAHTAWQLGRSRQAGERAFSMALAAQENLRNRLFELGSRALKELEHQPDEIAIVIFGRPYNAFATEANKGIPLKFASRSVRVIPFDILPFAGAPLDRESNMYWAMGRMMLQCARLVAGHPQLFATFITNFSCGPDSFIITYFRDIMGEKPSLTLELDSHTADAGIETRIEAFLDIIEAYRKVRRPPQPTPNTDFTPAELVTRQGASWIRTSAGELLPITDRRVKMMVPAMGRFGSTMLAQAFASAGVRAAMLPSADPAALQLGKENSNGKECLPLQTTVGSLLAYLQNGRANDEVTVFFMPSAPGPCRFGQYNVFTKRLIRRNRLEDVVVFSPHSANCYGGLSEHGLIAALQAVLIGDLFDEMQATLLTAAVDTASALATLEQCFQAIRGCLGGRWRGLRDQLRDSALLLKSIPLVRPYHEIPKISLVGEIYVRHDPLSLQHLVERLAKRGFIVRTSQNTEWLKYLDWLIKNGILGQRNLSFWLRHLVKERMDRKIRKLLAESGLLYDDKLPIDAIVDAGRRYVSPHLPGETILTVGAAFHEILDPACGVISLAPFGCMPGRVAEAILKEKFTTAEKETLKHCKKGAIPGKTGNRPLPFLAIETDGNPFPQVIEARLEAFCLQAERLHRQQLALSGIADGHLRN